MLSVVSCLAVWAHENVLSSSEVATSKHRRDFRPDSRAECLWHQQGEGSQNVALRELFHVGTAGSMSPFGCDHTSPAAISCPQVCGEVKREKYSCGLREMTVYKQQSMKYLSRFLRPCVVLGWEAAQVQICTVCASALD